MKLKQLSADELTALYQTELVNAFPPSELKPLKSMLTLMEGSRYEALSMYDENGMHGYALTWLEPGVPFALLDYFGRYYKIQDDPYLETREREERFIQQIVDGVCESLKQTFPLFLAGCMTGLSAIQPACAPAPQPLQVETPPAEEATEADPESIDWGFLGS
jgi:hypothetical protein